MFILYNFCLCTLYMFEALKIWLFDYRYKCDRKPKGDYSFLKHYYLYHIFKGEWKFFLNVLLQDQKSSFWRKLPLPPSPKAGVNFIGLLVNELVEAIAKWSIYLYRILRKLVKNLDPSHINKNFIK